MKGTRLGNADFWRFTEQKYCCHFNYATCNCDGASTHAFWPQFESKLWRIISTIKASELSGRVIYDLVFPGSRKDIYNLGTKDLTINLPEGCYKKHPDLQIALKRQPVRTLLLLQTVNKDQFPIALHNI